MTRAQQPLRNLIHLGTGAAAALVLAVPRPAALGVLTAALLVAVVLDLARLRGGFQAWLDRWLPGVYRPEETPGVSGATLLVVGYLLAVAMVPARPAAGGILALAVGDPAASVVGRRFAGARDRLGKSWPGSLACFAAAGGALWALPDLPLPAAAAGGAMAALIERRAGRLDNLLIPVGVAMLLNLWVA